MWTAGSVRARAEHNRRMLRLDPAHPPLWRDATTLQFGTDDRARLEDPQPWEEHALAELARGTSELALDAVRRAHGAPAAALDAFLADIQPVLRRVPAPARILVQDAGDLPPGVVDAIAHAAARTGALVDVRTDGERMDDARDRTVLLPAAHLVEPRRAAALVGLDVRHVPLVFDGAGATVGPVIEPGVTACLACAAAHARDADPAWPILASQLVRRACTVDADFAIEAARVAAQLISAPTPSPARSVRLSADGPHRVWRVHPPHEECACRSPEGSATGRAPRVRARETSSRTGFARPA